MGNQPFLISCDSSQSGPHPRLHGENSVHNLLEESGPLVKGPDIRSFLNASSIDSKLFTRYFSQESRLNNINKKEEKMANKQL